MLWTMLAYVRLAVRLLREPHVTWSRKAVPLLAVLYVISPIDFIPDVLPLIGEIDDLAIVIAGIRFFVWLCPSDIVAFHQTAIADRRRYRPMAPADRVIDAEWRRE